MSVDIEQIVEPLVDSVNEELVNTILEGAEKQLKARFHVPTATYRLQFNRYFTFKQARDLAEYLNRLGISDIYASPYFKARPDSLHGYDIANHNELNPAIGSEAEYDAMVEVFHRLGMYQLLDTVPNHMGIGEQGNAWWADVLENGRSSIYAPNFDIDWDPINTKLTNKVLLPVLGDQYGRVLENKELQLNFKPEEGSFCLHYYEHSFPVSPDSYGEILGLNKEETIAALGPESSAAIEYQSILTSIDHLPPHYERALDKRLERNREKDVIKRRVAALCASEPRVCEHIERNVEIFNGTASEPRSFDRLDALLERQPYRLSFWRVATQEINYRRFFDVNELAAVRVEQPAVFEETHRMIMRFLREGKLNGLRIDHVDGLRAPAGYFRDLQRAYFLTTCRAVMDGMGDDLEGVDPAELEAALLERYEEELKTQDSRLRTPLYVAVEKILGRGESLPADWQVCGTTGYEFTNGVNGLFVDMSNQKAFDEIYRAFTGETEKFADLVYACKKQIMNVSLASELTVLTNMLNHVSQGDRHYRDFTINSIRVAIREVIACFPVYRTYVTPQHTEVDKRGQAYIETAISRAKKRNPDQDASIFDFIGNVLLLKGYDSLDAASREARFDFVMKFQQATGPVIAKGLEDTAFYIYNRLISLNEVGGEPEYFGITPAAFHKAQADRLRSWPHSILTTSTHDTKRSEDVRARISVLSEIPKEWRAAVRRWARFNRKLKKTVDGQVAPSSNEEYFLYQTLLGVWPNEHSGFQELEGLNVDEGLVERLKAYMDKAMNEAKVNSSWINVNKPYQDAVAAFVEAILRPGASNRFLPDFLEFQKRVAHYGAFNSLSQTLLKITSPGVPDIYQGTEIWDLSLVDPDNRRPVDYRLRRRLLDRVDKVSDVKGAAALVESKEDGRIKLFVTSRALRYRRDNRALFEQGAYTPLEASDKHTESILAYARERAGSRAIVVVPRLTVRLGKSGETKTPVGQAWTGTWLPLPGDVGERYRNIFTGEIVEAQEHNGEAALPVDEILAVFPVALLEKMENDQGRIR